MEPDPSLEMSVGEQGMTAKRLPRELTSVDEKGGKPRTFRVCPRCFKLAEVMDHIRLGLWYTEHRCTPYRFPHILVPLVMQPVLEKSAEKPLPREYDTDDITFLEV